MAQSQLSYGMVVYSHAMGQSSTLCDVASRDSLRRSAVTKPTFINSGNAVASDRLVLAAKLTLYLYNFY